MKDCQFGVSPVNYSDSDSDSDCYWLLVCSGVLVCSGISMNRCLNRYKMEAAQSRVQREAEKVFESLDKELIRKMQVNEFLIFITTAKSWTQCTLLSMFT